MSDVQLYGKLFRPGEKVLVRKLMDMHSPDFQNLYFGNLLPVVRNILGKADNKVLKEGPSDTFVGAGQVLALSSEISYMCFTEHDGDDKGKKIAWKIAERLSSYSWEDMVVLALAAFALSYGEAGLAAQFYSTNAFAKALAVFKNLPVEEEQVSANTIIGSPKLNFNEQVTNLLNDMLDATQCIIHASEICDDEENNAYKLMVVAVYWTIRAVAELTIITPSLVMHKQNQVKMRRDSARRFEEFHIHFKQVLLDLGRLIKDLKGPREQAENPPAEVASPAKGTSTSPLQTSAVQRKSWKQIPVLQMLCMSAGSTGKLSDETEEKISNTDLVNFFDARRTRHTDNVRVLRTLFSTKDNQLPLFDCSSKKQVGMDQFRGKHVLLIVSDIGFSFKDDLPVLNQIYNNENHQTKRPENYEFVWLPLINNPASISKDEQKMFQATQDLLPCFSVYHPKILNPKFLKLVKQLWRSDHHRLLVVVLDPRGRVVNTNALHMLRIWGSAASPFTRSIEEEMWRKESWRVELLVQSVVPMSHSYSLKSEGNYICLYGGRNLEWIQNFRAKAQGIANSAHISLNMIYLGRHNPGERVQKIIATTESLDDHILLDTVSIKLFWDRLESMWHSRLKIGNSPENDSIMREIMLMLHFDCSDQGWALFSKGYSTAGKMAKAKGDTVMNTLSSFESWKQDAMRKDFVAALDEQFRRVSTGLHPSNSMILPASRNTADNIIPENMVCSECNRLMDKFITYQCPED